MTSSTQSKGITQVLTIDDQRRGSPVSTSPPVVAPDEEECCCGRKCKGLRGLKAHQRTCGFFKSLVRDDTLLQPDVPTPPDNPTLLIDSRSVRNAVPVTSLHLMARPGVKMPKSKVQWAEAIVYFHSLLVTHLTEPINNVDAEIQGAQDEVCSYFATTCGTVPGDPKGDVEQRYADQSIKPLKRSLKLLEMKASSNICSPELRYVSAPIRSRLKTLLK